MKPSINLDLLKSSFLLKITTLFFLSLTLFFFFFGKLFSQSNGYNDLIFFNFNITTPSPSSPIVHVHTVQPPPTAISPSPSISPPLSTSPPPPPSTSPPLSTFPSPPLSTSPPPPLSTSPPPPLSTSPPPPLSTSPPPPLFTSPPPSISPPTSISLPPPRDVFKKFGIVNENGTMSEEFEVGEYDHQMVDGDRVYEISIRSSALPNAPKFVIKRFRFCPSSMQDYIPCLDNKEAIQNLELTERGERFERHCPPQEKGLNCLVPPPKRYRYRIPWPKSRDEVWYNNVAHTELVDGKRSQHLISNPKAKFKFPGGDTQFIHGVDQYLDHISKMVPEIKFGQRIRVALDVGCGLASFGAYLLSRTAITMSVATKDVHENQIQFALERGVPAMVAAFATRRLLFPSQAFDLIHCSRCRINWTRDDGILLLEANRILRAGGYFFWDAEPVNKQKEALEEQWEEMFNLTTRLCWKFLKKDGYITIWKKPSDNSCYVSREVGAKPPLCDPSDDPDNIWYISLKACISPLPENGYGSNVTRWPARLQTPPDRLQSIKIDAFISRKELFKAESKYWNQIIERYIRVLHWKKMKLRNVMDMRAGFGGFAAALIDWKLDCWVMNVVPVSGPNTLPVIYDRGLIGVMHDWCEPFDTYPRTYDLLHAANLLSVEKKRCNVSSIMLEMDRILRPGGQAYIQDSITIMNELVEIGKALSWRVSFRNAEGGPHSSYRVLVCSKRKV